jgi:hypothetical protein
MDRECLYPGHPDTCTPWHYLELDGGRRIVTRVLVKVWRHRHLRPPAEISRSCRSMP